VSARRSQGASLQAELYALTHRGNALDAKFYIEVCAGAPRVLELGAGYGRMLAHLARPGRTLVGLDSDQALLARARRALSLLPKASRRGTRLVRGDMRKFEFESAFERVILPYNGLLCLLTQSDALACFRAARAALSARGSFVFDVWNPERFHRLAALRTKRDSHEPVVSIAHGARIWDVFERTRVRRARQRLDVNYSYLPRGGGAALNSSISQRYFRPLELRKLLARSGFQVQEQYGDFAGAPLSVNSPHVIMISRAL
jgi:SAM-dependent methyltransferase